MNKTLLVAKETYRREVKSWSYIIMIFLPFIFAAISIGIGYLSANSSESSNNIGVVVTNKQLKSDFKNSDEFEVYQTSRSAKKAYDAEDIDGYVEINQVKGQLQATYHGSEKMDSKTQTELISKMSLIQQRLNIVRAKLTSDQLSILNTQPKFMQKIHTDSSKTQSDEIGMVAFIILAMVMYLLVLTYTQVAAQDIATEKGTKVMEMIFSSMPGSKYFDGKIIGIFGEIVTQIVVYVAGGAILYYAAPRIGGISGIFNEFKPLIDQTIGHLVSWGLLFVVLGLILYVICAAFCGAIAAKPEDANKAVLPVTSMVFLGFFAVMSLQNSPDAMLAKVLSYVPFFSSFLMPLRIFAGKASNLEACASAVVLFIFLVALFIAIRRIYPTLILQTDDQGLFKSFKRALKS